MYLFFLVNPEIAPFDPPSLEGNSRPHGHFYTVFQKKPSPQNFGCDFVKYYITDVKNSFTDRLSKKFAIQSSVDIPPYQTYVNTLPCET